MIKKINIFKLTAIVIGTLMNVFAIAQDSAKSNGTTYRVSMNMGVGKGYPQTPNEGGIGGGLSLGIQQKKRIYEFGIRAVGEFDLFNSYNVDNTIQSVDVTFGKFIERKYFFCSINAGVGLVTSTERGLFISSEGGLFGTSDYERLRHTVIGMPISAKILLVSNNVYALGIEVFVNLNKTNTFFGINLCNQFGNFGKVKSKKKTK